MNVKRLINSLRGINIVVLGLGVMLLVLTAEKFVISLKPAVTFDELLETEPKEGMHIKGNVAYTYDSFASEETWTERRDGSRTAAKTSSYYYVIPAADTYLGLEVPTKLHSGMDTLAEETYDFLMTGAEPQAEVPVNGSIIKMNSELTKYMKEYLAEGGFSESEIAQLGEFYCVDYWAESAIRGMFAGGVVLLILAILLIRGSYIRIGRRQREAEEAAAAAAAAEQAANMDPDMERYFNGTYSTSSTESAGSTAGTTGSGAQGEDRPE